MWATHAKNALINISGFSPYQLVFGMNPNVPGVTSSNLPALEGKSPSETVVTHLNSLQKAREAYIKAESSERLRRALLGRVYAGTHQRFFPGDIVYFKREKHKEWHGPATVVAQDGTNVLVKSGGFLVRVHPCKMVLKSEADNPQRRGERATSDEVQLPLREHALASITDANEDDSETDSSSTASTPLATPEIVNHTLENTAEAASRQNRGKSPEATEPVPNVLEGELTPVTTREERLPKTKKKGGLITEVKAGDQIIYQEPESEDWNKVTLTSRGYRSTSLNKNY